MDRVTSKLTFYRSTWTLRVMLILLTFLSRDAFGQNIPRPNISAPSGMQVNTYSGTLFTQRTDFLIPGRGLSIDISFAYNSSSRSTDQGFGYGWTFGYNQYYTVDTAGNYVFTKDDGREDVYTPISGGGFNAPTGIFDVVTQYQTGKFKLLTKEGTQYFFDNPSHKKLTSIIDRYGNKLTFGYSGNNLSTIADSLGHVVTLIWTNNHVTQIVESVAGTSRKIQYDYNVLGCLVRVYKPHGVTLSYDYNTNKSLKSFADGNGNYTSVIYNNNYAVTRLISCGLEQRISYNVEQQKTYVTELSDAKTLATTYEFDAQGRLIRKSGNCCGYNTAYEYDAYNNISKITDGNNGVEVLTYDNQGNLLAETDALHNTSYFTYTTFNKVATFKDKRGATSIFSYDAQGNLLQTTDALNHSITYTYDIHGYKLSQKDKLGFVTTYTYDQYGYLSRVVGPVGDSTSLTNDGRGNVTSKTDPRSNTTTYSYDSLNRIVQTTDPLGARAIFTYDANGNQLSLTDTRGKTITMVYNWRDKPISITDALNHTTNISYDGMGNIVSKSDANGHSILLEYDNMSRLITETNAAGEITHYSYDGVGNRIAISYPNGNSVNLKYDALNRLTELSDVIGQLAKYTYDPNSNKLTEEDGQGNVTSYQYDLLNRPLTTTDRLGNTAQKVYDYNGNVLQELDRKGNATTYSYDSLNRRKSLVDGLNNQTSFNYDKVGNLTKVTDGKGNVTNYSYDVLNRLTQVKFADNTTNSYSYDSGSNLKTRTDNNGQTTTFIYDAVNRPVLKKYSATLADTFSYDNIGLLITARSKNAAVIFSYDGVNRLVSESLNGKITSHHYNIGAGQQSTIYPSGRTIERQTDARERLTAILEGGGVAVATFEYDFADRNTKRSFRNGTIANLVYNGNNQVTDLNYNPARFIDLVYSYDKVGNPSETQFKHKSALTEQFSYDNVNQLTSFSKGGAAVGSFAYDAVGNRTMSNVSGVSATYVSTNMNAYSSVLYGSTLTLSYDNNGNLTLKGPNSYSYDRDNRLIGVNGGVTAGYVYDALGRRIQKIVGIDTTNYYYDGAQLIEERSMGDTIKATYVWGRWVDDIISMQRTGQAYYYHTNTLGSVLAITNSAGNVVERYDYDPYGHVSTYDGSYSLIGSSTIGNRYLFTGREYDIESGLYFYRARYYDPSLGRFMQRDPLGYIDGMLAYAYVNNNGATGIDPYGLVNWWGVAEASVGLVGNTLGAIGGVGLGVATSWTGVGAVVGGAVAVKSVYGVGANAVNLWDALHDREGRSTGGMLTDIARAAAPCNKYLYGAAVGVDIGLDLLGAGIAKRGIAFYRAMSNAEYAALESSGELSSKAGKELFVSLSENYSKSYLGKEGYDVLVKFQTEIGTLNSLADIGVRNGSRAVVEAGFGNLPKVAAGWMEKGFNFFKGERGILNIGLGSNPSVFNSNIINFMRIP